LPATGAERTAPLNEFHARLYPRPTAFANLPLEKLARRAVPARLDEIGEGSVGMVAKAHGG